MAYREESFVDDKGDTRTPRLVLATQSGSDDQYTGIIQPVLEDMEDISIGNKIQVKLKGSLKIIDPEESDFLDFGFAISSSPDMQSRTRLGQFHINDQQTVYNLETDKSLSFEYILRSSQDDFILEPGHTYYVTTFLHDKDEDTYCYGTDIMAITIDDEDDNEDYVDLGLSVPWATCNVGASVPEELGTLCNIDLKAIIYSKNPELSNKDATLMDIRQTEYDYAYQALGGNWRMPSINELMELKEKCSWKPVVINDVAGAQVTGPNGNSIFLPCVTSVTDMSEYAPWLGRSYDIGHTVYSSGVYDWNTMQWSLFAVRLSGGIVTDFPQLSQISVDVASDFNAYVRPVWGAR